MAFAYPMQKFQDWLTQQWVILRGRKIKAEDHSWLMGPFGNLEAITEDYIDKFAEKETLIIDKTSASQGLIPDISLLNLSNEERSNLSQEVIDFYEKTADYSLNFSVKWNPFFKVFGILLNKIFSKRLNQLNIPTKNNKNAEPITSEIFTLIDPTTQQKKYTFWFRSIRSSGQVIYSGIYGICTLPNGKNCIKAVFPLPNGNATVIMTPSVGKNGELILNSSGKRFGDAGFYFLLKDSKGNYWTKYIRSFRDQLVIGKENNQLSAKQKLTLWRLKVLIFDYHIIKKFNNPQ